MKKVIVGLLMAVLPLTASAETFGIGAMVGSPTGITGKLWLDQERAVDIAAEWRTSGDNEFYLHANYLIHAPLKMKENKLKGTTQYYYGAGGYYQERHHKKWADEDVFALRLPVGISHQPKVAPIELFAEIVPVLEVSPDSDFDLDIGVGVRYLFR